MLTIVVLLSGPHRLQWLTEAIASIPLSSEQISAVHVMHQDGRWDWAPRLRASLEQQPKVRIIEFDQRFDYVDNFNRCVNLVQSRWALLLPDDDSLMVDGFAQMLPLSIEAMASDAGFIAYGWYYLKANRYVPDYVRRYDVAYMQRYTPKFCTTMINVDDFRQVGGFKAAYGGFCDTVLFAELAHAHNAWTSPTPAGIYRLHDEQATAQASTIYAPYFDVTVDALCRFAERDEDRPQLQQRMRSFVEGSPGRFGRAVDWLSSGLRGREVAELESARPPSRLLVD